MADLPHVLDQGFDRDGIATLEVGAGPSVDAVALAPDGKIVVAGSVFNGQDRDVLVAAFNQDGQSRFNLKGFLTDSFGASNDNASAVGIAPDGGIILAGEAVSNNSTSQFILARYRGTDGFRDITLGQTGHATVFFNDEMRRASARVLTLQPDGKIVSAGFAVNAASTSMAAARLLPDGKLDLSFGNSGRQITDFGGTDDRVISVLRASDGRIVLVGSSGNDLALLILTATLPDAMCEHRHVHSSGGDKAATDDVLIR